MTQTLCAHMIKRNKKNTIESHPRLKQVEEKIQGSKTKIDIKEKYRRILGQKTQEL
jgi:hypothetical protein